MSVDDRVEALFGSMLGALDVLSIALGDLLGLYPLLRDGPRTAPALAEAAGIDPRYAREWLEQQCVAGLLEVDDATAPADRRTYRLGEDEAEVLATPDSEAFLTPFVRLVAAAAVQLPALADAYRTGGGVTWSAFGEQMRTGQADANRPFYLGALARDWLPSVPELHARLQAGARVADVGCGEGWSSIGLARAHPAVAVDGYDVDPGSVEAATAHAAAEGLEDRVRFHLVDAGTLDDVGPYDVVTLFECVHDMPDPVAVLRAVRGMLAPGGTVMVMDERVPDAFTGPGDDVERLMYGLSLVVCLPDSMSHSGSVATGTVMRRSTLEGYARDAGFAGVEVMPVQNDLWRFYSLVP